MRLEGVVLLAAPTTRSQAYLQRLIANQLYPSQVIAIGEAAPLRTDIVGEKFWKGIALPNLSEPLAETCSRAKVPLATSSAANVNAEDVILALRRMKPKIVIYSGYGGQLVGADMLALGMQFLHVHSGWLPEYRGSTTIYYALLRREDPGVTAFILDRSIDTGPVVERRRYPKPSPDLDIDQVYDAAIRADLLVRVMAEYAKTGRLPVVEQEATDKARTYYVIHPVLKHLAILGLAASP
jgi:folate-dependent phosphoribosylglycinamide formyltransferase PurN